MGNVDRHDSEDLMSHGRFVLVYRERLSGDNRDWGLSEENV